MDINTLIARLEEMKSKYGNLQVGGQDSGVVFRPLDEENVFVHDYRGEKKLAIYDFDATVEEYNQATR